MRSEYQARMDRVIAYIDANLGGDLSLTKLSRVACFSEYHFHRIFKSVVGESVNEFVQRRRLETAARALHLNRQEKVIDVGLAIGYENPASFFKAFRRFFGASPSQWRENGSKIWTERQISQKNLLRSQNSKIGNVLNPKTWKILMGTEWQKPKSSKLETLDLPTCRVVYRRYTGRYGNPAITVMWGELMNWAQAHKLLRENSRFIGILHDDPSITEPENCRYDACLVVDAEFRHADALIGKFQGGKYLAYDFVGTPSEVDPAWDLVYEEFVTDGIHLADIRPNIELYGPNSVIDPEKMIFRSQLCVSIRDF